MSSLSELLLKFAYNQGYAVYSSDPEWLARCFPTRHIALGRRAIHMNYPSAERHFKNGAGLVALRQPEFQGDPIKVVALECNPPWEVVLRYLLQDYLVIGPEFLVKLDSSYLKNHNGFHKMANDHLLGPEFLLELDLKYLRDHNAFHNMVNSHVLGQVRTPAQISEAILDGPVKVKQQPVPLPSSGNVGTPLVTAAVPDPVKADPLVTLRRGIKDFLRRGG